MNLVPQDYKIFSVYPIPSSMRNSSIGHRDCSRSQHHYHDRVGTDEDPNKTVPLKLVCDVTGVVSFCKTGRKRYPHFRDIEWIGLNLTLKKFFVISLSFFKY